MKKNFNVNVSMESKSFEYKGNLKLRVKGLHVVSNGDHRTTESSEKMPAYSELHVGSLDATFHAEGGVKGMMDLAAAAREFKKCELNIGSKQNPFFGKDDIYAAINCSDIALKEKGVKARHTFHENGKVWHENIDTYDTEMVLDEFGVEGSLSDIGDIFMQIMGSINDERTENQQASSAAKAE